MKKKKQIKELKLWFNDAVKRNINLLNEIANLRSANEYLLETDNYMNSAGTIATLREEIKTSNARITEIAKENSHLRTENDLARAQLLDLQESFESAQRANKKLREENKTLTLQLIGLRSDLSLAQEKLRTPVFVPIK